MSFRHSVGFLLYSFFLSGDVYTFFCSGYSFLCQLDNRKPANPVFMRYPGEVASIYPHQLILHLLLMYWGHLLQTPVTLAPRPRLRRPLALYGRSWRRAGCYPLAAGSAPCAGADVVGKGIDKTAP